jgi:hypothetical protein
MSDEQHVAGKMQEALIDLCRHSCGGGPLPVIPAEAGIHPNHKMDPCLRRGDG